VELASGSVALNSPTGVPATMFSKIVSAPVGFKLDGVLLVKVALCSESLATFERALPLESET
jgi:hypothetical protein